MINYSGYIDVVYESVIDVVNVYDRIYENSSKYLRSPKRENI